MGKTYKHRYTETYNGVRIDVKANTQKELMEKVAAKREQIARQSISPSTTLEVFTKRYLETYKRNTVSSSWYCDLQEIAFKKIVPGIGNKPVGKIKPLEIQDFLNETSNLSASYIKKIYSLVCQIFKYAYKNGMTPRDYTVDLERPKGKKGVTGRSLTEREREALLAVLPSHRGNLFCKLMLYCGLRPGEVSALIWKDIDFKNAIIDINKARKRDGSVGEPKSADGIRKVPIPNIFLPELKENAKEPFYLVCPQTNGNPHTQTSIRTMWNNVKREMNIFMGCRVVRNQLVPPLPLNEDFKIYYLRHTYCTDLEKKGVPINIARQLMGHSDISITSKIYTHASVESLTIARDLINS